MPGRPRPTLLHRSNYHFSPPTKRETSTIRLSRLSRAYPLTLFSSPLSLPLLILLFFFFPSRPRRNFLFDAPREPPTRRWLHRLVIQLPCNLVKDLRSLEYASVAWATKSRLLRGGFSEYFASLEAIVGRDFYGGKV